MSRRHACAAAVVSRFAQPIPALPRSRALAPRRLRGPAQPQRPTGCLARCADDGGPERRDGSAAASRCWPCGFPTTAAEGRVARSDGWSEVETRSGTSAAARLPGGGFRLIAAIVLVVLVAGTLGTWALLVRPSMHSTFDAQMRSVLDSGISTRHFRAQFAKGQHTIPAKTFNDFVSHFHS